MIVARKRPEVAAEAVAEKLADRHIGMIMPRNVIAGRRGHVSLGKGADELGAHEALGAVGTNEKIDALITAGGPQNPAGPVFGQIDDARRKKIGAGRLRAAADIM